MANCCFHPRFLRIPRAAMILRGAICSFFLSIWSLPAIRRQKPGLKGPRLELIRVVVEISKRNPNFGWANRTAVLGFNTQIGRDVVRRILAITTRTRLQWTLLADFPGSRERQPLEYGLCSGASRPRYGPTGSWWGWINRAVGLRSESGNLFHTTPRKCVLRWRNLASALPTISFCLKAIPREP
jgi:hypothetical protein